MIWVAVGEGVKFGVGGLAVVDGGVELTSCSGCGDGYGAAPMGADGRMGRRGGTALQSASTLGSSWRRGRGLLSAEVGGGVVAVVAVFAVVAVVATATGWVSWWVL